MYVYKRTEFSPYCLYTVGYYEPDGKWISESDHETSEAAAERVAWLNGSKPESFDLESEEFYNLMQTYRCTQTTNQEAVNDAFKAVKNYIRLLKH